MDYKTDEKTNNFTISEILLKSLLKNITFYVIAMYCLFLLSKKQLFSIKFIQCIITWVFICMFGYFIHLFSHQIDLRSTYNQIDNIFTQNEYINKYMNILLDVYDFHDKIHHNIEVNKQPHNIFYEFIMNIYTQGICVIVFVESMKLLDYNVIVLWAFLYATVHNINYLYLSPTTHRDHHIDSSTNYGIDTLDIIFNTKYDVNDIEDLNHASINLLVITYIILYFTNSKED